MDGVYYFKDGRVEGVELRYSPLGNAIYRVWGRKKKRYFARYFARNDHDALRELPIAYDELPKLAKNIFAAETREGVQAAIKAGTLLPLEERANQQTFAEQARRLSFVLKSVRESI